MKILANDGISPAGEAAVKKYGFEISTDFIAQDELVDTIKKDTLHYWFALQQKLEKT